ncbi:MAG: hypothetical protein NW237_06920 [Cyanobacteriota bacterium]|nr:hypothetical protein [Cyanobacteriota bacterium]
MVDADGTVVLTKDGEALSVDFTYEEMQLIRGKVFTHNHPKGGSFSREDINFLLTVYPSEMRAVSRDYRYSMKLPDNPIDAFFEIRKIFDRVKESVRLELVERVRSGESTLIAAEQQFMHLLAGLVTGGDCS